VYKGRIYIVDKKFSRVAVFDTTGKYIMDIGAPGQGPGEYIAPTSICFFQDTIYILWNYGKRLNKYTLRGRFNETLTLRGGMNVAVDSNAIYLAPSPQIYYGHIGFVDIYSHSGVYKGSIGKYSLERNRNAHEIWQKSLGYILPYRNDTLFYIFASSINYLVINLKNRIFLKKRLKEKNVLTKLYRIFNSGNSETGVFMFIRAAYILKENIYLDAGDIYEFSLDGELECIHKVIISHQGKLYVIGNVSTIGSDGRFYLLRENLYRTKQRRF